MNNGLELQARISLYHIPQLGPRRFRRLMASFPSAHDAFHASDSAWRMAGLPEACCRARPSLNRAEVDKTLRWLEEPGNHLLMWDAENYPSLLAELDDAPPLLFVQGAPEILEQPQLAIVGSRHASRPGLDTARNFARELAGAGFVVTSGLALGVDGAAHAGALQASGRTLAVLGSGLMNIYPARHVALSEAIVSQGGALVSEFPLETAPQGPHFPRRNRIISGLSLGVLVVEAGQASGSLITARLAAEQGREVFAVPGSIHYPGSRGCHQLIREGAALVENVGHIMENLQGWQRISSVPVQQEKQQHPLLLLLQAAPQTSEALALNAGLSLPEVLGMLTELEIEGRVCCEGGLWVAC